MIQEAQSQNGVAHNHIHACKNPVAPVSPVAHVAPVSPVAHVVHIAHVAHVTHIGHIAHVGPLSANPLMKLYTAPLVDAINFPLALVPSTAKFSKLSIVTSPLNHAVPLAPFKKTPVAEVEFPSRVRIRFPTSIVAFFCAVLISNAFTIKSMQDIQRKNSVAHLMKLMPFLDCKFLLVKLIFYGDEGIKYKD